MPRETHRDHRSHDERRRRSRRDSDERHEKRRRHEPYRRHESSRHHSDRSRSPYSSRRHKKERRSRSPVTRNEEVSKEKRMKKDSSKKAEENDAKKADLAADITPEDFQLMQAMGIPFVSHSFWGVFWLVDVRDSLLHKANKWKMMRLIPVLLGPRVSDKQDSIWTER